MTNETMEIRLLVSKEDVQRFVEYNMKPQDETPIKIISITPVHINTTNGKVAQPFNRSELNEEEKME